MTALDDEPYEVLLLKKQLANLTCKCSVCESNSVSGSCGEEYRENDKEVQAIEQETCDNHTLGSYTPPNNFDFIFNNVTCPGCYITLNLLKAKETKVLKDEETETKSGLSCCDKSIGKYVKFVERTTSMSSIIKPAIKNSNASLCSKIIDNNITGIMKRRSNEHVTFLDHQDIKGKDNVQEIQAFYGHCFCLQNFIESIRPPIHS